ESLMNILLPTAFNSLSVILPVIDETYLLEQTVAQIMGDCAADIHELLIVVCKKTTTKSLEVCQKLKDLYPNKVVILNQTKPFLGGAMQDAFDRVSGSHVIMMASDGETPADKVKDFIIEAKKTPDKIITGSRWLKGGGFEGYSPLKYILNFIFQQIFAIMYGVKLGDMTYGFRIFPSSLVKAIKWEELRHPFLLETLIKPLRLGIKVKEIPTPWKARTEGESQNTFWRNFEYFRIGFKTRFSRRKDILI
ncbi:MAG: glycosyltransferase family 2 protein, partial [bacterium]